MSKFNKFIDQPRWFFKDAFKKRGGKIVKKLDSVNDNFKKVGIPIQFDLQIMEQSFVNAAVKLSHGNKLSHKIVWLISVEREYKKEKEHANLSNVAIMRHHLGHLVKIFTHVPRDTQIISNNQDMVSPFDKLSPQAKNIYLQLKHKTRSGGDN